MPHTNSTMKNIGIAGTEHLLAGLGNEATAQESHESIKKLYRLRINIAAYSLSGSDVAAAIITNNFFNLLWRKRNEPCRPTGTTYIREMFMQVVASYIEYCTDAAIVKYYHSIHSNPQALEEILRQMIA